MSTSTTVNEIDWSPILSQLQRVGEQGLPTYPGDLKTALLHHARLSDHPKAEIAYQLASDIAHLTTHCDPEIIYWFSRLLSLVDSQQGDRQASPTLSPGYPSTATSD